MWLNTTDTHAEVDGPGSNDFMHLRTNPRESDDDDTGMASRRGDNDPVLSTPFTDDIIKVHQSEIDSSVAYSLHSEINDSCTEDCKCDFKIKPYCRRCVSL